MEEELFFDEIEELVEEYNIPTSLAEELVYCIHSEKNKKH